MFPLNDQERFCTTFPYIDPVGKKDIVEKINLLIS